MAFDWILGEHDGRDWSLGGVSGEPEPKKLNDTKGLIGLVILTDKAIGDTGKKIVAAGKVVPETMRAGFAGFFKKWQNYKKSLGALPPTGRALTTKEKFIAIQVASWQEENNQWNRRIAAKVSETSNGKWKEPKPVGLVLVETVSLTVKPKPKWPLVAAGAAVLGGLAWLVSGRKKKS